MVNNILKAMIIKVYGSQGDFSDAIGVNESFTSRVIHGRKELSKSEKLRWAKRLKCRPEEIFEVKE